MVDVCIATCNWCFSSLSHFISCFFLFLVLYVYQLPSFDFPLTHKIIIIISESFVQYMWRCIFLHRSRRPQPSLPLLLFRTDIRTTQWYVCTSKEVSNVTCQIHQSNIELLITYFMLFAHKIQNIAYDCLFVFHVIFADIFYFFIYIIFFIYLLCE